jgi:hypothetical protein
VAVNRIPAAPPDAGEAAAAMSARHGWLRFQATGRPLAARLDDDVAPWQAAVLADHRGWYGPDVPAQVAGAFVLQYLLQVPAHTAATAASVGLRVSRLGRLSFDQGAGGVPRVVEIGDLEPDPERGLDRRLERAADDYLRVAEPLARGYVSSRRMSTQQRLGMVVDMWAEAARVARSSTGVFSMAEPRRVSCCLIYALPGCVECVGCPRGARR